MVSTIEYFIKPFRNPGNAVFGILVRKCARVKHNIAHTERMRTANLLLQKINSQLVGVRLVGAEIDNIWSVNDDFVDPRLLHGSFSFFNIHRFNGLAPRVLRSPGVYHE
ncbi:hypothetical protein D3C76_1640930 [compost metagenome]